MTGKHSTNENKSEKKMPQSSTCDSGSAENNTFFLQPSSTHQQTDTKMSTSKYSSDIEGYNADISDLSDQDTELLDDDRESNIFDFNDRLFKGLFVRLAYTTLIKRPLMTRRKPRKKSKSPFMQQGKVKSLPKGGELKDSHSNEMHQATEHPSFSQNRNDNHNQHIQNFGPYLINFLALPMWRPLEPENVAINMSDAENEYSDTSDEEYSFTSESDSAIDVSSFEESSGDMSDQDSYNYNSSTEEHDSDMSDQDDNIYDSSGEEYDSGIPEYDVIDNWDAASSTDTEDEEFMEREREHFLNAINSTVISANEDSIDSSDQDTDHSVLDAEYETDTLSESDDNYPKKYSLVKKKKYRCYKRFNKAAEINDTSTTDA